MSATGEGRGSAFALGTMTGIAGVVGETTVTGSCAATAMRMETGSSAADESATSPQQAGTYGRSRHAGYGSAVGEVDPPDLEC